ncbi:hypothetical protein ACH4ND_32600 [Streptomyces sp. NPDC017179]|uniref:hypothetical protein n=1 Tax=Streptomyces sp. NPDC017179 TaxID=3364979 RepID=UPI0037A65E15
MHARKALAVAALGATLALSALSAPAAQAAATAPAAETCGNTYWPHQQLDGTIGKVISSSSAAVHTGPYGSCTGVGEIAPGTKVEYDCYVRNDYGNTWTWVRVPGGGSLGWVYDAYLSNNGSGKPCKR